jgi:hypothetical protein
MAGVVFPAAMAVSLAWGDAQRSELRTKFDEVFS